MGAEGRERRTGREDKGGKEGREGTPCVSLNFS